MVQAAHLLLVQRLEAHLWWSQWEMNPCFRLKGRRPHTLDDGTEGMPAYYAIGGEGRIRTYGWALPATVFMTATIKPLSHLSDSTA